MRYKKLMALFSALLLAFAVTACDDEDEAADEEETDQVEAEEDDEADEEGDDEAEEGEDEAAEADDDEWRFDGSSEEAADASIEALPEDQAESVMEALAGYSIAIHEELEDEEAVEEHMDGKLDELDGMTADELTEHFQQALAELEE